MLGLVRHCVSIIKSDSRVLFANVASNKSSWSRKSEYENFEAASKAVASANVKTSPSPPGN